MDADRVPPLPRRARWGVRKRATATAVLVVAAALVVGGLVLLVLLQTSLVASTETSARRQAADVIAQISGQDVAEAGQYIASTAHTGQYVQILAPSGTVFAASVPAAKTVALTALRPGPGETLTQDVSGLPSLRDGDDFLIVATGVDVGGRLYTVVVAATVQVQADTVSTVAWFILGATPALLAVVGGSVWVLVGRSLRQVERIRGQVAGISARSLDGRVDVPPTDDEIQALAETMNMMLGRLQASDQEQRRFVSDASHELRSPLATLSAGVEIAAADASGATWEQMKTVLAGETARMRYLVEDLLTLAKTNDGGLRLETTDVDLDDVLNEEVLRLRSTSTRRIEVSLEPVRVAGDPRRLGQVVRNVLDNADRHAASRISIRLRNTNEGALITIDNDGAPVPVVDRERIFERFVRLDQSRSRESGGSGLGLAIAAGIMAAHRGWIRTGEAPGGGCRFELGIRQAHATARPQVVPDQAGDPRHTDVP
ncbi:ATP-binding protein [Arthrobacter sp. UYEF3]|uniref:sensor histidine kinase n=1 Tax=Arthrobacter sp. UYEF3 TaxID=1756365 RepID=UPI003396B8D3